MGGNIVDSLSGSPDGRAHCWVLKGQPIGPCGRVAASSVPGSGPGATSPLIGAGRWPSFCGLGFGGVFVNWIVDASI